MVRVKSKYKKFATGGAVHSEQIIMVPPDTLVTSGDDVPLKHEVEPEVDDASEAFKRQIEAVRNAGEVRREQEKLAALQAQVEQILKENPAMVRHPDLVAKAERQAFEEGHDPYSPEFHRSVLENFNHHLNLVDEPEVSQPSPSPLGRSLAMELPPSVPRGGGAMVSAPVSRDVPDGRPYEERREGRVTLSVEERDMARRLGISETDYAANKLKLAQKKREGLY